MNLTLDITSMSRLPCLRVTTAIALAPTSLQRSRRPVSRAIGSIGFPRPFLIRPSVVSSIDDSQTESESDLSDNDKTEPETQYSERIYPPSGSKGCPNINVSHDEVAASGLIIPVSGAPV